MKKYQLPSYPAVRGRFHDQDSFAAQSHEAVASMLDAAEDQFGVVHAGCGGGYLVNFTEGTYMDHPVSEFVLMFRPERDYANAAELIEDTWYAPDLAEEQAEWAFVLGPEWEFNLHEIPVSYLFEDQADADAWLEEYHAGL